MEAFAVEVVKKFALDSAKTILEMLLTRLKEEIRMAWAFKDDLENLQSELKRINILLLGTNSDDQLNPLLEDWLNKIRAVAYEAENMLDEYAYELMRRRLEWRLPAFFRLRMARKIDSLKQSIDDVYIDAQRLGIKPIKVAAGYAYTSSSSNPMEESQLQLRRELVDFQGMLGRDHDKAHIIDLLCGSANDASLLTVVGIFGMAGLGKTTLCRNIFQTTEVTDNFVERIWICVSHDFDLNRLLNNMIEQVYQQASNISSTQAIISKLQEKLQGKKYILALDDVWDTFTGVWESLRCALQEVGGSKGTVVMVTSRSIKVLENLETPSSEPTGGMNSPCLYQLRALTEDDSWNLFKQRVGDDLLNSARENVGRKLIAKCKGVPLAIRTLGDLLRSRKRIEEWREIEESEIWSIEDLILPSVKLSYKYLPNAALKKCFAYCAVFQEDEVIQKDRLIQLWMAQGFLQPYDKMEQVGEQYFHALLNNSLFQDPKFDELGNVVSCKMHDVVHTLSRVVSSQELRVFIHDVDGVRGTWVSLAEDNKMSGTASVVQRIRSRQGAVELGNLRSSFVNNFYQNIVFESVVSKIKYLRALGLVGLGLTALADDIGELKHLRYLDLSKNHIIRLPSGLTKLYNLQTLVIKGGDPQFRFPELPKKFSKLVNLRYIVSDYFPWVVMGMPKNLGKLNHLRILPPIELSENWGGRITELAALHDLKGTLELRGIEHVAPVEALVVDLRRKKYIEKLILSFSAFYLVAYDLPFKHVLDALQPHPNLSSLQVERYCATTWPPWMQMMTGYGGSPLSNLVSLSISECYAVTTPPELRALTSLEELKISSCYKMENLRDITPLLHLKKVHIESCLTMTCLPSGIGGLRNLTHLSLGQFHPHLLSFPFPRTMISTVLQKLSLVGSRMDEVKNLPEQIQHIASLSDLTVEGFHYLEALPEWLGKLTSLQRLLLFDMGNLKHLPSHDAIRCLRKLSYFRVQGCPLLSQTCEDPSEWAKIQHIQRVFTNVPYSIPRNAEIIIGLWC